MRLEYLAYILEVSKHPSITSASESLYISPQALSSAIKNFEQEIGLPLLVRNNKGIKLTKHGKEICEYAKIILENVDKINTYCLLNQPVSNIKGNLVIASSPVCSILFLPQILCQFTNKYPDIKVATLEISTNTILENLLQGKYDIGIVNASQQYLEERYPEVKKELYSLEICQGKLGIICSQYSPVYTMESISWEKSL